MKQKTGFMHFKSNWRLPLMAALFIFISFGLRGQTAIRKMANGLDTKVVCGCTDSLGIVYAVTNSASDTAKVYRWDSVGQVWNLYTQLPRFKTKPKVETCNFFRNKFYLTGVNLSDVSQLMEFNGSSWKTIARFGGPVSDYIPFHSVRFNNKLYFSGGFDSVGGVYMRQVTAFDGSTFSSAGFPPGFLASGYYESPVAIISDSLFVVYQDKIYLHKSPNKWSVYYNSPGIYYFSVTGMNSMLYVSSFDKVIMLKDSIRKGLISFNSSGYGYNLTTYRNRVYMAETPHINQKSQVYSVGVKNDVRYMFSNEYADSGSVSFFQGTNTLCYYGYHGVKIQGVDYNSIGQINVDSFISHGFDTIRAKVFWDQNNNYKKDIAEASPVSSQLINISYGYSLDPNGADKGSFEDFVPKSSNVEYGLKYANFDSCLQAGFTGSIVTKNGNKGITTDTVNFPLLKGSTSFRNLVLRNNSLGRARLMDSTVELRINIRNRDCYNINTNNGSVTLTLDPNTTFLSSVPTSTSVSGNVITFSNLTFNYSTDNIISVRIVYSNATNSIGKLMRHYARLGYISGEDTTDNMDSIVQKLVYSYDPNMKQCVPEGKVTKDLKTIRYYIYFQNMGNAYAKRVRIVDTLNLRIPVYEFRMVGASHPYSVSIAPGTNIVTWIFDDIYLWPKSMNEDMSKGYVIFEAKLKTNVGIGDSIRNKASIFFDYNDAIITNYAVVHRVDPKDGSINRQEMMNGALLVYPNPGQDHINLCNLLSNAQQIRVYDLKGALVTTVSLKPNEVKQVDTDAWAEGMYILVNDIGSAAKIIIE